MYKLTHDAAPSAYCAAVCEALEASPYVGDSPLGPEFVRTRGFSLIFRRTALADVTAAFPFLEPFLDRVVFEACNAFYVNPVIMARGSKVGDHIDCRLVEADNVRIIPNLVSILYVLADPDARGGALRLRVAPDESVAIQPRSGDLLHFKGSLIHSVDALEDGARVSLVCEQYNLPDPVLAGFPEFEILQSADIAPRVSVLA